MNALTALIRTLDVEGRQVETDSEGYLVDRDDWSEAFARALAEREGIDLTAEHWEVIRFLREYFAVHGVQAQVRVMIRHFTKTLGCRARDEPSAARDVSAWRPAEAGQPPCRPAANQRRALITPGPISGTATTQAFRSHQDNLLSPH